MGYQRLPFFVSSELLKYVIFVKYHGCRICGDSNQI